MWAGRGDLVGLRDVLVVPQDIRKALSAALPAAQYTLYGLSAHHACAVTHQDEDPYEMYIPYSTARNRPETVDILARTGCSARRRLVAQLPPHADRTLPVCRDVWLVSRGRPWKQCGFDVLFGDHTPSATFPMTAHVFLFSEEDVRARNFSCPLSIECNVPLRFKK